MSATNKSCNALRVPEQRTLFGGLDLLVERRRGKPRRSVRVDSRWKVGFATALAIVIEHGKKARETSSVPSQASCPRCGLVGDTERHFGTRVLQGKRVPQSWCRNCRKRHLKPRVRQQASLLEAIAH